MNQASGGVGPWKQFIALMRKNASYQSRHKAQMALVSLLPAVIMIALILVEQFLLVVIQYDCRSISKLWPGEPTDNICVDAPQ